MFPVEEIERNECLQNDPDVCAGYAGHKNAIQNQSFSHASATAAGSIKTFSVRTDRVPKIDNEVRISRAQLGI